MAETLYTLHRSSPDIFDAVVEATQSVLGLPSSIQPRESDDRFYFVQNEPGLRFPVHQMGVSSGTLRMLALMTALLAEPETNLVGTEEPENYLGRSPGNVDTSKPDAIHNPKLHLKHLLGKRVYTARLSEEIAQRLVPCHSSKVG